MYRGTGATLGGGRAGAPGPYLGGCPPWGSCLNTCLYLGTPIYACEYLVSTWRVLGEYLGPLYLPILANTCGDLHEYLGG